MKNIINIESDTNITKDLIASDLTIDISKMYFEKSIKGQSDSENFTTIFLLLKYVVQLKEENETLEAEIETLNEQM